MELEPCMCHLSVVFLGFRVGCIDSSQKVARLGETKKKSKMQKKKEEAEARAAAAAAAAWVKGE